MQQSNDLKTQFQLFEQAENIDWVNHPNHFFRISKFILPLLSHSYIPEACLLSKWKENKLDTELSLSEYICKPLFSFGGQGVMLDPTIES
jgi:glutathionylspermidine synthase